MAFALPPGTDLSTIPAGIPPPGVIPNFVNPPSLVPAVFGINITFMVITAIFVSARLTVNLTSKRKTGIDDCMFISELAARLKLLLIADRVLCSRVHRCLHVFWTGFRPSVQPFLYIKMYDMLKYGRAQLLPPYVGYSIELARFTVLQGDLLPLLALFRSLTQLRQNLQHKKSYIPRRSLRSCPSCSSIVGFLQSISHYSTVYMLEYSLHCYCTFRTSS